MSTDLSLRLAQKYVEEYEGRCDGIMRRHSEAMQCRDCEELLEHGLKAYQWIRQADETIRQAAIENVCTTDEELALLATAPQSLHLVFDLWLRPCEHLEPRIAELERTGYTVAHAADFRAACEYVRRWLEKSRMHDAIEDAFQGRVFDDAFWAEAARMRTAL